MSATPSFVEQHRLEQALRATLRRALTEAKGIPPSDDELDRRVRAEIPALYTEFGIEFLQRLADKGLSPATGLSLSGPKGEAPEPSVVATWLTEEQRKEAEAALWYAKLHGIESITEALEWHTTYNRAANCAPCIRKCADEFLIARRAKRCSPLTLDVYRTRLDRFVAVFGDRAPKMVAPKEIADYLRQWERRSTRLAHWDMLSTFYNWMAGRRYVLENPVGKAMRRPRDKKAPGLIFTVEEAREILRQTKNTDQIAFWTLSLFAGMRCYEIERLNERPDPWKIINLKRGLIDLRDDPYEKNRRCITILPVLNAWLSWIRAFDVPFYPPNHWNKFRIVQRTALAHRYRGNAKEDKTTYAIARRSYISYKVALSGASFVNTADEAGQSERLIRSEFYRRVSVDEANAYFELGPKRV